MESTNQQVSAELKTVIHQMKKIQARISGSEQPAFLHEIDELMRLGREYATLIEQLAQLQTDQSQENKPV